MSQNNAVTSNYYSGQGILMIAPKDSTTGRPMGFLNVGNVSSLSISLDTSTLEHKESSTGARGTDLRLTTEISAGVSAVLESLNKDTLAIALRGSTSSVTSGSAADEMVYAYVGKTSALSHLNVTNVVVKGTNQVGNSGTDLSSTTYTVDTDYTVNEESGSINVITGGGIDTAITANASDNVLAVSYDYTAQEEIEAMTEGSQEYVLRFEGLNTAESNNPVVVTVHKFLSDPLQELALINDDISQMTLEGNALADQTQLTGSKYFSEVIAA